MKPLRRFRTAQFPVWCRRPQFHPGDPVEGQLEECRRVSPETAQPSAGDHPRAAHNGDRAVEAAETFQDALDRMTGADDAGTGSNR